MLRMLKKVLAAFVVAVIALGYMSYFNARTVSAQVNYEDYYADYTEINYISHKGNPIRLYVDGETIGVESDCITEGELGLFKVVSYLKFTYKTGSKSFVFKPADKMTVGEIYSLSFEFKADGRSQIHDDLKVVLTKQGDIKFIKSLVYEENVNRAEEWRTDSQSLQECLMPQNDVECDDPRVIAYAQQITRGCTTDWEKALAIYDFVTNFAYDNIQVTDRSMVYHDDPLCLIRRKIAVCEGLGNTFVALCRAVGVPSCVCFGIGVSDGSLMTDETYLTNEHANHAWAAVCLDGKWYSLDPTWDIVYYYEGESFYKGEWIEFSHTFDWYLVPLEDFSMTHKITDADTIHGLESMGSAGPNSSYKITRDGTITFYGTGSISLPDGCNGFSKVAFDPDSNITTIGTKCFFDCDLITNVVLPDSVTRIEDYAFNSCEDLEYVYLPNNLSSIGMQAFDYCDELAYMYIPDSIRHIGDYAFDDCQRLIISLPEGYETFADKYYIKPASVTFRQE